MSNIRKVSPNVILDASLKYLAPAKGASSRSSILTGFKELHLAARSNWFEPEYNFVYLSLIDAYRHHDLLSDLSQLDPMEVLCIERSLNQFLSIAQTANNDPTSMPKITLSRIEKNLQYVNFNAGLFALAREDYDQAYLLFAEAKNFESKNMQAGVLAQAALAKTVGLTAVNRVSVIRSKLIMADRDVSGESLDIPGKEVVSSATVLREQIQVVDPITRNVERSIQYTKEASDLAVKKDYLGALRSIFLALKFDPDNLSAKQDEIAILKLFMHWFTMDNIRLVGDQADSRREKVREILGVRPTFGPALILFANDLLASFKFENAIKIGNKALENATDVKEKQHALFILGLIYHKSKDNERALEYFLQMEQEGEVFLKAVFFIASCYDFLEQGQEGLDFIDQHGKSMLSFYENYFRASFLRYLGGIKNIESAQQFLDKAYTQFRNARSRQEVPPFFIKLNEHLSRLISINRAQVAKQKAKEDAIRLEAEALAQATAKELARQEAERQAELDRLDAQERFDASKWKQVAEKELLEFQATLDTRKTILDAWQQELEAIRTKAIALLDQRFAELKVLENRLLAQEKALVVREQALEVRESAKRIRQVIEVEPKGREKAKSHFYDAVVQAMITGKWDTVMSRLEAYLKSNPDDAIQEAFLAKVRIVAGQETLSRDAETVMLKTQYDQVESLLAEIKKERTELKKQVAELEVQLQQAGHESEMLRRRLVELGGEKVSKKQRSFDEAWEFLKNIDQTALQQIEPALAGLFTTETLGIRGGALMLEEIIDRRRQIIAVLIEAFLNKGEKISSWTLIGINQACYNWITNKKVAPNGFDSIRKWVEAILKVMKGEV